MPIRKIGGAIPLFLPLYPDKNDNKFSLYSYIYNSILLLFFKLYFKNKIDIIDISISNQIVRLFKATYNRHKTDIQ